MVKAILAVSEKFIVLQMAEKLFIDEAFKYLTYYRKQDDGSNSCLVQNAHQHP